MGRWVIGLCLLALGSQAQAEDVPTLIGPVSEITVAKNGLGPRKDRCEEYRVTPDEVADFLRHALLITSRQEHDWFLHGPCHANGTLSTRYGTWQWQLLNLGTARLTAPTGETFVLADPRQESSLADD